MNNKDNRIEQLKFSLKEIITCLELAQQDETSVIDIDDDKLNHRFKIAINRGKLITGMF